MHGDAPNTSQWRHIVAVAVQVVETTIVPVVAIALACTGIWTVRTGLVIAATALALALTVIAVWAVRRMTISVGRRALIVVAEMLLGTLVIGIKLLAH